MKVLFAETDVVMRYEIIQSVANGGYLVDMAFDNDSVVSLVERFDYSLLVIGVGYSEYCAKRLVECLRLQQFTCPVVQLKYGHEYKGEWVPGANGFLLSYRVDDGFSEHRADTFRISDLSGYLNACAARCECPPRLC